MRKPREMGRSHWEVLTFNHSLRRQRQKTKGRGDGAEDIQN